MNLFCIIGTVETYLGFWRERLNFGIAIAEIQPKVWEKRRHVNAFSKIIIIFFWESRSLLLVVLKNHITIFSESFWLILQNLNLICFIGTVESYLGFWGERLNFGITIAEIQPKVWDRRRKRWREKMLNFGNVDTKISLPNFDARVWGVRGVPKVKRKKKLTN